MSVKPLKVCEVNQYIKRILMGDPILSNVCVEGEISNFKHHYSGHMYFSLKDEKGKIKCVMFKSYNKNIDMVLKDGIKVIVNGYISVYERDGDYQLYVKTIEEAGLGDLYLAYNKLLKKLEAEGIFNEMHKKEIPKFPRKIGIVTSSTGAAIRDIITVVKRRFPIVELIIYPVLVQGEGASKEICEGLLYFNNRNDIDLVITGRGGGSIEELFAFNDELLARTIYGMDIPVISAVGHETDFTIADFVADLRAPTPSAAAELAVPRLENLKEDLNIRFTEIVDSYLSLMESKKLELDAYEEKLNRLNPINKLNENLQYLDSLFKDLTNAYFSKMRDYKNKLEILGNKLDLLSPLSTANRGYGILTDESDKLIKSVEDISIGEGFSVLLKDGTIKARVEKVKKGEYSNGFK
ncbi:exodeoxyribonuclease VII large subunit [Anaerosalibacter sp. Marseille-P3206]|uniref:exodeoxyribonuclease VII large subunit n=1 Tax=Anaerosalibacter sp. Marseille-P3206 TaxID=1871005 RepID=UPI000987769B|nr:exodeoxyribonuclease VII large subunit [Anaerosalibacter sp. Marseille-P3206]